MVIGLLILTAIPCVTGVAQSISSQKEQKQRKQDEVRMKKFFMDVHCDDPNPNAKYLHEKRLILKDERVWIGPKEEVNPSPDGYVAEAFYIEYPDPERVPVVLGLVSQVQADPPLLNWVYIDGNTMELRYGNKSKSIAHHVGPWDWAEDEEGITFDDYEEFTAVEDPASKRWQLFADMSEEAIEIYVPKGRKTMTVYLKRHLMPVTEA